MKEPKICLNKKYIAACDHNSYYFLGKFDKIFLLQGYTHRNSIAYKK